MANFEGFEPIFGEAKPECANSGGGLVRQSLFHVYAPDSHHIKVHVSDFHSNSWEAMLSVAKVDDMRDSVGIGGSWSEFIDYLVASLHSENVKLLLEGSSGSNEFRSARLVSQRVKGMPRIPIALKKIVDSDANEAMANLSLELFKAYKSLQLRTERHNLLEMKKVTETDKEDDETTHHHLETQMNVRKLQKIDSIVKSRLSALPAADHQNSYDKQLGQETRFSKAATKRVPANRRVRKRGAVLHESEEDSAD